MESGDEDDAFSMGEREWQKMNRDLSKQGYREGKSAGKEKGLQQSFEAAVNCALACNMKMGQLAGMTEWKMGHSDKKSASKFLSVFDKLNEEKESCKHVRPTDVNDVTQSALDFKEKMEKRVQELSDDISRIDVKV